MRLLLHLAVASVLAAAVAPGAARAHSVDAAGAELYPVADRYEPGDVATMVGYTAPGSQGRPEDGPFYAYLVPAGGAAGETFLGELTVTGTGHGGWRALRVLISFPVPEGLEAGFHTVYVCNDTCRSGLGDLAGGTLPVGVSPDVPVVRVWPLDEPEIAALPDDAIVAGPGYEVLVSVIRGGGLLGRQAPLPPTTQLPLTTLPRLPSSETVHLAPPPAATPPPPVPAAGRDTPAGSATPVNGGWLAFGSAFAAACVLSVLMALRQSHPARRVATS